MRLDLGTQGGDLRGAQGDVLDLGTCVNRYGPSPAALASMQSITASTLRRHPFEAADLVVDAYARALGVPADQLVPGRGTTEFVWRLTSMLSDTSSVAIPLPAYTEFIRAFPAGAVPSPRQPPSVTAEDVAGCMAACDVVIISNPSNPTGQVVDPALLAEIADHHPQTLLVVDESYVDFCVRPKDVTVIGHTADNILVLRAPSKFYGIAAARIGVAWTLSASLRQQLAERRGTWPVSGLDAAVAVAALADTAWEHASRRALQDDGGELERMLTALGAEVMPGARAQYRLWQVASALEMEEELKRKGIIVRLLCGGHGFAKPALRISAPRVDERERLTAALQACSCANDRRDTAPPDS